MAFVSTFDKELQHIALCPKQTVIDSSVASYYTFAFILLRLRHSVSNHLMSSVISNLPVSLGFRQRGGERLALSINREMYVVCIERIDSSMIRGV